MILSGYPVFGSPEETSIILLGDDNSEGRNTIGHDLDSILMSEVYEFILLSNPPPETKGLSQFSHLLPYKLQHAFILTDYGFTSEVQKILDAITKANCKEMPKLGEIVEGLIHRVSSIEGSSASSSSWFGGKIGRPKFDKIVMQSFNKFVAGDDDAPVANAETGGEEGGIFKRLASTPAAAATGPSGLELSPSYFTHQPYAASQRQLGHEHRNQSFGGAINGTEGFTRVQSHSNMTSYPPHPTSTYDHASRTSSISSPIIGSGARSRPISPNVSSSRKSSSIAEDLVSNPYAPLSRPGSSQNVAAIKPLSRPFTPETVSTTKSVSPGVLRESAQVSPKAKSVSSPRVYNPYAPASTSGTTSSYNPYAPAATGAANTTKKPVVSPYEALNKTTEDEEIIEEVRESTEEATYNPYGAIYGGNDTSTAVEEKEEVNGSEESPEVYTPEEPEEEPEKQEEQPEEDYPYEAPSYGYQAEPINEEEAGESDGNFYTPAVSAPAFTAPTFTQTSYKPAVIPEEEDEDEDDLGFANTKKSQEEEQEEEKDDTKAKQSESKDKPDSDGKKGWFSGWFKKDDGQPKAVRAKLGDESSFYYDEKLKRWVNKKAPVEDTKSSAPPPPPKSSKPIISTSSSPVTSPSPSGTPPLKPPSERASSAPIKSPLAAAPPGPPRTSTSKPTTPSTGGGLDDLLASAPTSRKPLKRNARSRYVDIMAQK